MRIDGGLPTRPSRQNASSSLFAHAGHRQISTGSAVPCTVPRRLTLGSDAWQMGVAALRERFEALESEKDLAFSTDPDDYIATRDD